MESQGATREEIKQVAEKFISKYDSGVRERNQAIKDTMEEKSFTTEKEEDSPLKNTAEGVLNFGKGVLSFAKDVGVSFAEPFTKTASTIASAARGTKRLAEAGVQKVMGEDEKALQTALSAKEPVKIGETEPIESSLEALGAGGEAAVKTISLGLAKPTTLLEATAKGFGIGSGMSATKGMQEEPIQELSGEDASKKLLMDSFVGGLVGAGVGAAFYGAEKWVEDVGKKNFQKLLDVSKRKIRELEKAGKDPAEELAEQKIWGTLGGIEKKANEASHDLSLAIDEKVRATKDQVNTKEVIDDIVERLYDKYKSGYSKEAIRKKVEAAPIETLKSSDEINMESLRELQKLLSESTDWRNQAGLTDEQVKQSIYGELKKILQSKTNTKEEFASLANLTEAKKLIAEKMNEEGWKELAKSLGWGDPIRMALASASVGFLNTPEVRNTTAAIYAIKTVMNSPIVRSTGAVAIENLKQVMQNMPQEAVNVIKNMGEVEFINLVNQELLMSKEETIE